MTSLAGNEERPTNGHSQLLTIMSDGALALMANQVAGPYGQQGGPKLSARRSDRVSHTAIR
jgi:hypothetical protein